MKTLSALPCLLLLLAAPAAPAGEAPPKLLTWSEQNRARDAFLEKKHALLLAMMRAQHVDWWIVVNEEFHADPLTPFVAPARP